MKNLEDLKNIINNHFSELPYVLLLYSLDDLKIIEISDNIEKFTNYKKKIYLNQKLEKLYDKNSISKIIDNIDLMKIHQPYIINNLKIISKKNNIINFNDKSKLYKINDKKYVLSAITPNDYCESNIVCNNLLPALDIISDAIWIVEKNIKTNTSNIIYINNEFEKIWQISKNQITDILDIERTIMNYDRHKFNIIEKSLQVNNESSVEIDIQTSEKKPKKLLLKSRLYNKTQDTFSYINQATDITGIHNKMNDIKNSEEMFRRMFEKHNAIMLIINPENGKIVGANDAATNFYGYTKEQFSQMTIHSINMSDNYKINEYMQKSKNEIQNYYVFKHKLVDGSFKFVDVYSKPILFNGEKMLYSVIHDVTERVRTEEMLKFNEEKYRLLADNSLDVIFQINFNTPDVNYISPSVFYVTGYTAEELQNNLKILYSIVTKKYHSKLKKICNKESKSKNELFKVEIMTKNNLHKWLEVQIKIVSDDDNQTQYIQGTARDITLKHINEIQLTESENILKNLVNATPDIMVLKDKNNLIKVANLSFLTFFKLTDNALLIKDTEVLSTFIDDNLKELYDALVVIENIFWTQKMSIRREIDITVDNQQQYFDIIHVPMFDADNNIIGVVSICRDITQIKKMQQKAETASIEKSRFLANMSHEIRTPMNGVLGMTELLLSTSLDEEQKEYAKSISQSGKLLLEIINDILDFSKIEEGKLELENIEFSLYSTVEEILNLIAIITYKKNIDLNCYLEPETPDLITGDPTRLKQILLNLLNNAIKFTTEGEVNLYIKSSDFDNNNCKIEFIVEDTGIGMNEKEQLKLFKSFSQIDNTISRKYGGSGLGLVICKKIITKMKGEITVESAKGKGSKFIFYISTSYTQKETERKILKDKKIAIISPDSTGLSFLTKYIENWGAKIEHYKSAETALKKINNLQKKDFIIIEQRLSGMDGWQFLSKIKDNEKITAKKFLIIPHGGEIAEAKMKLLQWADDYIYRPFYPGKLQTLFTQKEKTEPIEELECIENNQSQVTVTDPSKTGSQEIRVLIAEDNLINQKLISIILRKLEIEFDIANNGEEAVKIFTSEVKYDIILMDLHMPVMDGIEATRKIRETDKTTPIVAVTADIFPETFEQCEQAEMNGLIKKPYEKDEILNTIKELVLYTQTL